MRQNSGASPLCLACKRLHDDFFKRKSSKGFGIEDFYYICEKNNKQN